MDSKLFKIAEYKIIEMGLKADDHDLAEIEAAVNSHSEEYTSLTAQNAESLKRAKVILKRCKDVGVLSDEDKAEGCQCLTDIEYRVEKLKKMNAQYLELKQLYVKRRDERMLWIEKRLAEIEQNK